MKNYWYPLHWTGISYHPIRQVNALKKALAKNSGQNTPNRIFPSLSCSELHFNKESSQGAKRPSSTPLLCVFWQNSHHQIDMFNELWETCCKTKKRHVLRTRTFFEFTPIDHCLAITFYPESRFLCYWYGWYQHHHWCEILASLPRGGKPTSPTCFSFTTNPSHKVSDILISTLDSFK